MPFILQGDKSGSRPSAGIIFEKEYIDNLFYLNSTGFNNVTGNFSRMIVHAVIALGVLSFVFFFARYDATRKSGGAKRLPVMAGLAAAPAAERSCSPSKAGTTPKACAKE